MRRPLSSAEAELIAKGFSDLRAKEDEAEKSKFNGD